MASAKKKKEKKPITSGASSGHSTKLKQSILLRCLWLAWQQTGFITLVIQRVKGRALSLVFGVDIGSENRA
jgi:hypothetical protein